MLPAGSSLPDWLTWLETLSPKEIDLGLDRVKSVLDSLSLPFPDQLLLVAGTNGKGSSVAMLDALLGAAGYRVGVYTSPHLIRFNERIAVVGVPVADEQIVAAFERIESVRDDLSLTYFEYGTLAAMVIFSDLDLDAWVLEIGLGGRLDACNAVEPSGEMLNDGARGKRSQRPVAWCAVAGPSGARSVRARYRRGERQHVRYAAQVEVVVEIVEPVLIFQDQAAFPHLRRLLEVLGQCTLPLGDEQWVVCRQSGNERRR